MTEQAPASRIFVGTLEPDPSAERILRWFADEAEPAERVFLPQVVSRYILGAQSQVIDARHVDVLVVISSEYIRLDTEVAADVVRSCQPVETGIETCP